MVELFFIVSALPFLGSADFRLPSLASVSGLLRIGLGTTDLTSHEISRSSIAASPVSPPPSFGRDKHGMLDSPLPSKTVHNLSPSYHPLDKDPGKHSSGRHSKNAFAPSTPSSSHPLNKGHSSAPSPSFSHNKHRHARNKVINYAPEPSNQLPPSSHSHQGPSISPIRSPLPSSPRWISPAPETESTHYRMPIPQPTESPSGSSLGRKTTLQPSPPWTLLPPPPNEDCTTVTCTEPLTYTPPGSSCNCVWPIEIRLRLKVALYTFFPLVTELAKEIAAGISLNRSQVRIVGANAATQQMDTTDVLINLVPLRDNFGVFTAYLIYKKFWGKQVHITTSLFGAYEVVYVHYPGLPPSPPSASTGTGSMDDLPYPNHDNDGRAIKPLGVDVPRKQKDGIGKSTVAVIVLSSVTAFVVFIGVLWLLLLKTGGCVSQHEETTHVLISSQRKTSGTTRHLTFGSRPSSASMSVSSSLLPYTGTAKIFGLNEIERATDNFDASNIIGEGGFGLVYGGILDDGRKVAVKVLKRDDHQGCREFLAEVEMLGRLHHRNLVKLIGICTEDNARCLVYELVPNGSVESHLHGVDKEIAPLGWGARMKIALGAARGLAYLHEDSSPCVIHRDFKSSNILLEHDFTPKVSDFGLARTAIDEGNKHISTHVMGTFGYLAPEYAMTGHLLVKSDVYSYGVVLLELLTGRKPIDLSQPPGQENLVAWARPLLTTKEGLEAIIDPALKSSIYSDSVSKVAAIASMCVQPEVSNRPFMGEVVQALKLVCNELDETTELVSRSCSHEDLSVVTDRKVIEVSGELEEASQSRYPLRGYDYGFDSKLALSTSDLVSASAGIEGEEFGSFRRQSNSAPLGMGKKKQFWQRIRGLSRGSTSEHRFSLKFWPGSH